MMARKEQIERHGDYGDSGRRYYRPARDLTEDKLHRLAIWVVAAALGAAALIGLIMYAYGC
ncbi:MAG: hypothetical protein D6760_03200 [Deltaproteobacteria bacterium]|nr:MAG: hypothetical protein D6760_03200 [Deltaproteobacteria bacterium]